MDDAIDDYLESARLLAPLADYLVVNVSSPNTPGLRGLQELDKLAPLLDGGQGRGRRDAGARQDRARTSPTSEATGSRSWPCELGLDGIIATNTTLSREGLRDRRRPSSRRPARAGSRVRRWPRDRSSCCGSSGRSCPPDFCVISVGGVETADGCARERLDAGATLVQGYTAFLYRGPLWARADQPRARAAPLNGSGCDGSTRGTAPRLTCGFGRRIRRSWSARMAAYQRTFSTGPRRTWPRACA